MGKETNIETNMFKRFNKYKKWNDLINFKKIECIIPGIIATLITIILIILDVHTNILIFSEGLKNITIYIATALIGMLGLVFAGMSIFMSALTKEIVDNINKNREENFVDKTLTSFQFISFIMGILIVVYFIFYIMLFSSNPVVNIIVFYVITFLLSYMISFVIFYIVALIGNCVKVYHISHIYEETLEIKKENIGHIIDEIRIDYIFEVLNQHLYKMNGKQYTQTLVQELNKLIDERINDQELKKQLISYINKHYPK